MAVDRAFDPATLEVLRHRFFAVAEEMGAALVRTAYATNIKDRRDCSAALFTPHGEVIAQAEHIPIHLGVLPWSVKGALARIPLATLKPGDVIMHNDPFIGGTHTPDIVMFAPVFYADRLVAMVGNLAHHVDVGGKVPGSLSTDSTEIFQEGIRFPPVRLQREGILSEEILAIHSNNVRTVYEGRGDLMAQLASLRVGQERFQEICAEFGSDTILRGVAELAEYCDRRMAAELRDLPVGRHEFEDVLEGDGISDDPLTIHVAVEARDDSLHFDFTGTSAQSRGPLNAVLPMTLACVYYVVKAITDQTIPPNEGTYRRIHVQAEEGSLLNARLPAATGYGNATTVQRVVDVLLGALSKAVPERVCAASTGSMNSLHLGGLYPGTTTYYSHIETYGGGYGATLTADGASGVHTHMTNTRNAPVEVLETVMPIRVERYGLVPDSEGPGRQRGGFGIAREFTFFGEHAECVIGSDRSRIPPWGLMGGLPAGGSRFVLARDDRETQLPSKTRLELHHGDRLLIETSGGGGWGPPLERRPEDVRRDVQDGLVSKERARSIYGLADVTDQS